MANILSVTIKNNKIEEALQEMKRQATNGLNAIGLTAEGYAKEDCPVDTGRLRNSINFATENSTGSGEDAPKVTPEELTLYLGTNVEYAEYVELGTGIYASNGAGRKTPWYYYSEKLGRYVLTHGIKPTHFLRDAMANHGDEYRSIMDAALKS